MCAEMFLGCNYIFKDIPKSIHKKLRGFPIKEINIRIVPSQICQRRERKRRKRPPYTGSTFLEVTLKYMPNTSFTPRSTRWGFSEFSLIFLISRPYCEISLTISKGCPPVGSEIKKSLDENILANMIKNQ